MAIHISERRTEAIINDLLNTQGWQIGKPPKGAVLQQNEYKGFPYISAIFKGKSKTGLGDGYPDFLVVSSVTQRPVIVIEAKANQKDFSEAVEEACFYGDACRANGHPVIAIGIAGQERLGIQIGAYTYHEDQWIPIVYREKPISWIPRPEDISLLLPLDDPKAGRTDLAPVVPRPEVLAAKADLINRVLREASIKDEYRPAYIGAIMLAMWRSGGTLRRDPDNVLRDINVFCREAFQKAGKSDLAYSLYVDEANTKLGSVAWIIIATLEQLNVATASFAHDYLGQLYEAFFRYTGGNTIGQYFTPRHIARFMADICETSPNDSIIDPTCGTGGFLIACLQRAFETGNIRYEDAIKIIRDKLIGYEYEPVTAALCVVNMILRGDGTTGVRKDDCFKASDYPIGDCSVALMNPPFPHKNTDTAITQYVERALEALKPRGRLAVILPTSLIVKRDMGEWRKSVLAHHSLLAVCQMPDELFQPYASTTTSVLLIEKGVPHNPKRQTAFVRLQYDGLTLKKNVRVMRNDGKNQLSQATDAILNRNDEPGFSGMAHIFGADEWSPGAYISSAIPTEVELTESVDELLRRLASFYVRYAAEVARLRQRTQGGDVRVSAYRDLITQARLTNAASGQSKVGTIGEIFDIFYGQKELHSREGIAPGDSLIISPTEQYNGCYGWLTFEPLIKPPFVTVAQTGSIGEAFVQLEPCGVNDDCLILLPKQDKTISVATLFIAAATIRLERWRFNYGRKLTPQRISDFPLIQSTALEQWVEKSFQNWQNLTEAAVQIYSNT